MEPARVLVADYNEKNRLALVEHLQQKDFVGEAIAVGDGRSAWRLLQEKPFQVVITDLMMPWMDGLILLDAMREQGMTAKVIVTSPALSDEVIERAMAHGANYFVLKPYAVENMVQHVASILLGDPACLHSPMKYAAICARVSPLDERLAELFQNMGITPNLMGYSYLRYAIGLCVEEPHRVGNLTHFIFPSLCARFEATPANVERSIRNAIDVAWERGDVESLNRAFGFEVFSTKWKPSNAEFISMLANQLRLNYSQPIQEDTQKEEDAQKEPCD